MLRLLFFAILVDENKHLFWYACKEFLHFSDYSYIFSLTKLNIFFSMLLRNSYTTVTTFLYSL